ncbi:MAG: Stp1/IreP family PP2C-type Ser/Thr phosphatase [Acidobacteriales bacterium]|nr:Stp1/IreP family PP2C-type Ser/Thr phosphatase [Terriglobales bacterium]
MRMRPGIELATLSDIGCARDNNEDYAAYWEPEDDRAFTLKGRLLTVADGMGGYEGGQDASRMAVETIQQSYEQGSGTPEELLVSGFRKAHQKILQQAASHPSLKGMGTTCTAVALIGQELHFGHVGDSRLYLLRGDKMLRLSRDHSYVGRLVETGVLTASEAEKHPQRHILTAALGAGHDVPVEVPEQAIKLSPGDTLLLCTDGLWNQVPDEEMMRIVQPAPTLEQGCHDLVERAKDRGGPDNITVQLLRILPF